MATLQFMYARLFATNTSCELDGVRITVDFISSQYTQDLKMGALMLHRELIGRVQAGGKEGGEKYVVYYKPVATRREELYRANAFREYHHPVSQSNKTPIRSEIKEGRAIPPHRAGGP